MTAHSILIGARGTGLLSALQDAAQSDGKRYIYAHILDYLVITRSTTTISLLKDVVIDSSPTVLVIEDIEEITNSAVEELVEGLILWTEANRDLEIMIYWNLVDRNPESIQRLTERLLPLVQLG